jgi:6-pyruvoyltetrahydropterin/6-carboxytetrahydropterin synthase
MPALHLERRYRFSASHLYRRPEWTEEENRRHFGKCANLPGHGHNYRLFVTVTGDMDPQTGFLVDLPALDRAVQERVLELLDHQHLNTVIHEFREGGAIPSSENLIQWIQRELAIGLPEGAELVKLRLEEDEDLAAEWLAG